MWWLQRDEESDDDAGSDITSASQDSQIADLYTLGIGQEYIKSEVCNRAMSNYTNIQVLISYTLCIGNNFNQ